jgi:hypothetical protein
MKFAFIEPGPQLQVVNGNGGYLIPGLWDMKTHVKGLPAESQKALFDLYVANGVTGVRDLNTIDEVQDPPDLSDLRPEIEPANPLWLQRMNPAEIRGSWGHTVEDLNEILAACCSGQDEDQSSTRGHDHRRSTDTAAEFSSETAQKIFIEISDQATWVVPGLVAEERADAVAAHGSPAQEMIAAPAPFAGKTALSSTDPLARDIELVRSMHRVGVQFLAGTGGELKSLLKTTVAEELELLVRGGLTPLEALQSATINPALCVAKLNKYGVVEADHVANLVLLGGNPLQDIRNTHNVAAVVLRGQYLARPELDAMLADAENGIRGSENAESVQVPTRR